MILLQVLILSLLSNVGVALAQVRQPSIGDIMMASPDVRNIRDNCVLAFSIKGRSFTCAKRVDVNLTSGNTTTVVADVNTQNKVICSCAYGCNPQGMVLGYMSVSQVNNGSFTISHARAIGNEIVSCIIY